MTRPRPARPPCIVCGSVDRSERNHVAARANDRALTVPMCRPCHDVFTDWQWRLGIIRHETPAERAGHDDLERAWALIEGFGLLAMLGDAGELGLPAVVLGRATGRLLSIAADATGQPLRWGPRPALRRGPDGPAPAPRGVIALPELLRLLIDVCTRLADADPRLLDLAAGADAIAGRAAEINATGTLRCEPAMGAMTARIGDTLALIAGASDLDALVDLEAPLRDLARTADRMLDLFTSLARADSTGAAIGMVESVVGRPA